MELKSGQDVWVKLTWVGEDFWEAGTVVKVTDKRVKVEDLGRGDGYYKKENVKPR